MIELIQARPEDLERVMDFYGRVADAVQFAEFHPGWQRGLYPRHCHAQDAIERDVLYLGFDEGQLVGAVVLDHEAPKGYEQGHWAAELSDDDLLYIHTFAVSPEFAGRGYGKKMLAAMKTLAEKKGMKGLRLDVLEGYDRAQGLYESSGFRFAGLAELFYNDVGWKTFRLYETSL